MSTPGRKENKSLGSVTDVLPTAKALRSFICLKLLKLHRIVIYRKLVESNFLFMQCDLEFRTNCVFESVLTPGVFNRYPQMTANERRRNTLKLPVISAVESWQPAPTAVKRRSESFTRVNSRPPLLHVQSLIIY